MGMAVYWGSSLKLVVPFNILAIAKARDFNFGIQLGVRRPVIKSHAEEKVGVALATGASLIIQIH